MLMTRAATKHTARERMPNQSVDELDLGTGMEALGLLLRRDLRSCDAIGKVFMLVVFMRNDISNACICGGLCNNWMWVCLSVTGHVTGRASVSVCS